MKWNSKLYDKAQSYVSEFGKSLLDFIPAAPHLQILDLGCGTGDITQAIAAAKLGHIRGVDSSPEMIVQAQAKYPHLIFGVEDACALPYHQEFDVIISNAVFHWINDQRSLHQSIHRALKENGLLICEFGAQKNIAKIMQAYGEALSHYGGTYTCPFYFPSVTEHTKVLQEAGLTIEHIESFERPTPLPHAELGLREWMRQFFSSHLAQYTGEQQDEIFQRVECSLKEELFDGKQWVADYHRLRAIARK